MSITGIEAASASGAAAAPGGGDALGKEDFLNLLVAQLKHQDPLNPMEGTEFTAQLAQFSSLEQLRNIGDGIGRLEESQAALHRTEALAYLGKEAAVADERLTVAGGQADPVRFSLSEDAAVAVVSVADGAGNPVRIFDRSALVAGEHQIEWNGCDARGNPLADGTYRVEVSAFDGSNRPVAAQPFAVERITGLSVEEAATTLLIGERRIGVEQIIEVTEP